MSDIDKEILFLMMVTEPGCLSKRCAVTSVSVSEISRVWGGFVSRIYDIVAVI